jgi:hypothetical protein
MQRASPCWRAAGGLRLSCMDPETTLRDAAIKYVRGGLSRTELPVLATMARDYARTNTDRNSVEVAGTAASFVSLANTHTRRGVSPGRRVPLPPLEALGWMTRDDVVALGCPQAGALYDFVFSDEHSRLPTFELRRRVMGAFVEPLLHAQPCERPSLRHLVGVGGDYAVAGAPASASPPPPPLTVSGRALQLMTGWHVISLALGPTARLETELLVPERSVALVAPGRFVSTRADTWVAWIAAHRAGAGQPVSVAQLLGIADIRAPWQPSLHRALRSPTSAQLRLDLHERGFRFTPDFAFISAP